MSVQEAGQVQLPYIREESRNKSNVCHLGTIPFGPEMRKSWREKATGTHMNHWSKRTQP